MFLIRSALDGLHLDRSYHDSSFQVRFNQFVFGLIKGSVDMLVQVKFGQIMIGWVRTGKFGRDGSNIFLVQNFWNWWSRQVQSG